MLIEIGFVIFGQASHNGYNFLQRSFKFYNIIFIRCLPLQA